MKGDVFTKDAIDKWIHYKRTKEVDALPSPAASV